MVKYEASQSPTITVTITDLVVPTEITSFGVSPADIVLGESTTISGYLSVQEAFWLDWAEWLKVHVGLGVMGGIPNATITININGTPMLSTTTDANGKFDVVFTPDTPGTYTIQAIFEGMTV